jgi:hypothetical protein
MPLEVYYSKGTVVNAESWEKGPMPVDTKVQGGRAGSGTGNGSGSGSTSGRPSGQRNPSSKGMLRNWFGSSKGKPGDL